MAKFNVIIQQEDSTVVSQYESKKERQREYQSEADLEKSLIEQLISEGYEAYNPESELDLIKNLRQKLEELNSVNFTDNEWNEFFNKYLSNEAEGIEEKTRKVQEDYIYNLKRDNGEIVNIRIIEKKNIHKNSLQVMHQFTQSGNYTNRYDVTILVNGLPLVHIELKKRGVSIKEAFNQIRRYNRDSFWVGAGLFEYTQIYVISNGTETKYYSNTTRDLATKENNGKSTKRKTSNSFEFTSYWADANNKNIYDLYDFAATFFSKHTLLNILTKYCIFTVDKLLLVMRPYQICATEKIINRINIGHTYKRSGTKEGGGYIWHTTGSGKTLTSFKTARLATDLSFIDKVLFVVDRKDLDYQTMREYDKFQKGAANSNTNTAVLKKQIEDSNCKIIITTIQKLSIFVKKNQTHDVYNKEVVIIFDECHRSQFGDMHKLIINKFKKYYIFGFTGTPIFAQNAARGNKNPTIKTTEQAFGEKLHTYTIVNAIHDKNVLPFRIDYINTIKSKDDIDDEDVYDILREEALLDRRRITLNVKYILDHFAQKTKRNEKAYRFTKITNVEEVASSSYAGRLVGNLEQKASFNVTGFNSILACASVEAAKRYYEEFKKQNEELTSDKKIKIALIYSWCPNEDEDEFSQDGLDDENNENVDGLDASSRDFLEKAIQDYNSTFGTSYDTSSEKFQNYYKDVSLRVKNKDLDLLIVVNMFLTGFDATTLNTLWVDKRLKQHGLIQAFSRTNRILNSIKTYGNIVCFRNLEKQVNDAIALFGDKDAGGIVLLKSFDEYYNGYSGFKGYKALVEEILNDYPIGIDIIGESNEKCFIKLFNELLKTWNILSSFDDFKGKEIISDYDFQDYQSIYINLYDKYRNKQKVDAENINDDIEFEIELVKSIEVNIDYILMLVAKYHENNCQDKDILVKVNKAIDSSPTLRNKKDLILQFIDSNTISAGIEEEWKEYLNKRKEEELNKLIDEEKLDSKKTHKFIDECFKKGDVSDKGTDFVKILPPMNMFSKNNDRSIKKKTVFEKIKAFFERFFNL